MFTKTERNGLSFYTSPLLTSHSFIHGFFTKQGGVSGGCFSSLNVSTARKDRAGYCDSGDKVFENYRRALNTLGADVHKTIGTTQVHGNIVLKAVCEMSGRGINPALLPLDGCDGLIIDSSSENIDAVVIKTADCVPILLADKKTGNVAAIHAGWRGTVSDIVTVAAEKMKCDATDLLCAIGPSIGVCCYEVGQEVYESVKILFDFKGMGEKADEMFIRGCVCSMKSSIYANLPLINKTLLMNFGVPEENIDLSGICTCCGSDEFFSHRGSGGHSGTFPSAILKRRSYE